MSNILWKSFNLCISKFKCIPTITFSPPIIDEDQDDPIVLPTILANNTPSQLFKNFNSIYDFNSSDTTTSKSLTTDDLFSSDSDSENDPVPDFTSAFASRRFFLSTPGQSNSIVERPVERPTMERESGTVVSGGVAVNTYSPDPYADFRKSMQEMIEAREIDGIRGGDDWQFLHELLLCYLTLNPKHNHKFILGAFADVIVSIVWPPPAGDTCRKTGHRRCSSTSKLPI